MSNVVIISKDAAEWLDGELLGDGCIRSRSEHSAFFRSSSRYSEYTAYVSNTLSSFGVIQTGKICEFHHEAGNVSYHYNSHEHEELFPFFKRWYFEGRKIVPRDIELTPITCRQWYIGDGHLSHSFKRHPLIDLATYSFDIYDVEWLCQQLQDVGILATRLPSNNLVGIHACSVKDFLRYIGECPVKCYQYKWDYFNKNKKGGKERKVIILKHS